jgi:hypothetical protein
VNLLAPAFSPELNEPSLESSLEDSLLGDKDFLEMDANIPLVFATEVLSGFAGVSSTQFKG